MNYYNNPYYNPYNNSAIQYQPTQAPVAQVPQPTPPALNGKMVDSIEMVKATEVPIGSYGIFPKGDLSEIYIKSWNPNGTTSIQTFQPVIVPQQPEINVNELLKRMEELERRISEMEARKPVENIMKRGGVDAF